MAPRRLGSSAMGRLLCCRHRAISAASAVSPKLQNVWHSKIKVVLSLSYITVGVIGGGTRVRVGLRKRYDYRKVNETLAITKLMQLQHRNLIDVCELEKIIDLILF